ncbi:hypothetical protein SAMN05216302_101537 [Nitrosomonas aestuarii]|uniref:Uncharacterized protein n=1 Tax=Nitrosomonas aestuarii TaxID=52441 RepID=A0A1I4CD21_9PROT|nr:hypothetical protein SAMN05216302_101537 [Nitrosomonas aestuarii]
METTVCNMNMRKRFIKNTCCWFLCTLTYSDFDSLWFQSYRVHYTKVLPLPHETDHSPVDEICKYVLAGRIYKYWCFINFTGMGRVWIYTDAP